MSDPFMIMVQRLDELGFFTFLLPFILSTTIIYALLRKSKIFGDPKENVTVNATIAVTISMMVLAAPILAGIDVKQSLAKFSVYSLIMFVIIMSSLFALAFIAPEGDISKLLSSEIGGGNKKIKLLSIVALLIGIFVIAVLFSSGIMSVLFGDNLGKGLSGLDETIKSVITFIVIIGFIIGVIVFVSK